MNRPFSWLAVPLLAVVLAVPAAAQEELDPYLFILFDTSGSMSWSPPCPQDKFDLGECAPLCPTGDCYVPLQADGPGSKFFQIKEALHTVLSQRNDALLGFATFNQDTLNVRAKHWLYEATSDGPTVPGWGPFPAIGTREVFGFLWPCDNGSGDSEIGCLSSAPADLADSWEATRVRRLPKGGASFNQTVDSYIRHPNSVYRMRYAPVPGGVIGSPVSMNVTLSRCANVSCTSLTLLESRVVSWQPVSEFLSWDNGGLNRIDPQLGYFAQFESSDSASTNSCSGWDPNTDTTADRYNGYSLRWPTDSSDPRGSWLWTGDVIPLDWNDANIAEIQRRLAPNLAVDPLAIPDFRISPYLRDSRQGAETFLRLKDENARPLIPNGSTPLGNSLRSFRTWYAGCAGGNCPIGTGWVGAAAAQDPTWGFRRLNLLVVTDGDETCAGTDACGMASDLTRYGIRTFVIGVGMEPQPGNKLSCMAHYGGTEEPYLTHTRQELIDALNDVWDRSRQP
jgi:hypothetical protein